MKRIIFLAIVIASLITGLLSVTITAQSPIRGDVDRDGDLDMGDLTLIKMMIFDEIPAVLPEADIIRNGCIDMGDIVKGKRLIWGVDPW